jgi:hypothetical protein
MRKVEIYRDERWGEPQLVLTEEDRTPLGALRLLWDAVQATRDAGCIDHIDACDLETMVLWEGALRNTREVLERS